MPQQNFRIPLFEGSTKPTRMHVVSDFIVSRIAGGKSRRLAVVVYLPEEDALYWLPRLPHFDPIFATFTSWTNQENSHPSAGDYEIHKQNGSFVAVILGHLPCFPDHLRKEITEITSSHIWKEMFTTFIAEQTQGMYPQDIEKRLKKRMDANLRSIFG